MSRGEADIVGFSVGEATKKSFAWSQSLRRPFSFWHGECRAVTPGVILGRTAPAA